MNFGTIGWAKQLFTLQAKAKAFGNPLWAQRCSIALQMLKPCHIRQGHKGHQCELPISTACLQEARNQVEGILNRFLNFCELYSSIEWGLVCHLLNR